MMSFERSLARPKTCRRPVLDPGLGFFFDKRCRRKALARVKPGQPTVGAGVDKFSDIALNLADL
jgi:hypothetical protein